MGDRAAALERSNKFHGRQRPHVGRKAGTGHMFTPAPAAYTGIDAYTKPHVRRMRLDGKELRETSLLMCQPGLPEGISKAKAANPGPGHYGQPDRLQTRAPHLPRQTSLKGCEWDKGIQQPGLPPSSSKWTRVVPGPNAYDCSLHDVGPVCTIGGRMANSKRETSQLICQPELPVGMSKARAANPGPGYYERFDTDFIYPSAPSATQDVAKREDSQIICQPDLPLLKTKGNMNNPGPAQYEIPGRIGEQQYVSSSRTGARCIFGTSQRPGNTTAFLHQAKITAARSGNGKQVSSRQRSSPSFGFGTGGRTQLIDM